jgi:hypothetical protein
MRKLAFILVLPTVLIAAGFIISRQSEGLGLSFSYNEAGFDLATEAEDESGTLTNPSPLERIRSWQRPAGPLKVALQAGHWKVAEVPEELENLKRNGGATGGGKTEWQVNLKIAELTRDLLLAEGIEVDILPTTIPPDYWADAFVAIHADGNPSAAVSGYKVEAPRRDVSGRAFELAALLETEYAEATNLQLDPNVTRNMRGYYAFNWRRYEHSLHPMTPAVILETGFLTSPHDRQVIVNSPEKSARAITDAIVKFLKPRTTYSATEVL